MPVCLRTASQVCPGGTTIIPTSSDATLSGLALADSDGNTISLNPGFAKETATYTASVANGIETVTLTATKNDSNATVVIASDDNTGTPGVAELDLIVGPNTLTVTVTAEDGTTTQPYTITVTRAAPCTDVWCATLTVQSLSDGAFGCATSQSGKECSAHLTEDEFTHDSTDYEVSGLQLIADGELRLFLAPPNDLTTASQSLVLLVGSERFPFAHADTKEERGRYWINSGLSWSSGDSVDVRLVEATASNDTTLSDLEIVDSNGDAVALSPSFAADETDYTASVEDGVLQITVTAAASDANNKLDYLDRNGNALRDADTAAMGHQVVLDAGETVVQVQVTAEDGTTMTYRASVTRLLTIGATVLVTNLAETLASVASGFNVTGQGFTTGSNPGGYRLTAVVVRVHSHQGGASDSDTHVTLWSNNNGPDAMIAELTTPPLGNGSRTYAAPAGVFLDPNRSYHVLVNYGLAQGDRANVRLANSERETSGYGWTIGNSMRFNAPAVPTNWNFNPTPVSMQIEGQELPGVDNTAAVGAPAITGTASLGQMLSAGTAGISDANGKTKADAGDAGYAYANQWQRVDADGSSNPVDIAGATQSTYTVISADVGSKIRVQVNFRDDAGYPEGPLTSNALPAAGTVTCDGLWCATLYVRSLGSGNRGCANSSPDNICSNTAHLSEDAFTHDLTDYAVTSVQVRSDGELRLFLNPDITAGSESLVLHAGSATFAFGDADATGANSRYWDSSGLGWSNGDAVELKLTESGVSTDATLTGLALNDGTTDHTIDLATTPPYTLDVVSAVTTVTLTATPTHTGASVSEVTLGGTEIADTDFTDGITVPSLAEGANVIVVTVTAEDDNHHEDLRGDGDAGGGGRRTWSGPRP